MTEVHRERRGDIAILTLDRPVANALAPGLRRELARELDAACADADVAAIVLCGAGAQFSTGVDAAEYGAPPQSPWVDELCLQIEQAPKPVVVALHGTASGGGFELALAAHRRVAQAGTQVALPEVQLGLVPNGCATQRVPRLAGGQVALELMLSGKAVDVGDPRLKPIIDRIVPGPPLEAAIAEAQLLARDGQWPRAQDRVAGLSDPLTYQNSITTVTGKLRKGQAAEAAIVRCIEAAQLLPYARGLELERVTFEDRRAAPDARALRHLHAAERRAMIMPERAKGRAAEVAEVVIPGRDALVAELVVACLDSGLRVNLMAEDAPATEHLRQQIGGIYETAVSRNVLTPQARDALMARLVAAWPAEALARADVVLDIGQIGLRDHHHALNPDAVWVPVTANGVMPATTPQGIEGRVVGMRVYRPALSRRLVELSVPQTATADAVVTIAEMFSRMGRTVIHSKLVDGLVGGNMSAAFFGAALALAEAGAGPYRVDKAARGLGFATGPFEMMDAEGLSAVRFRLNRRPGLQDPEQSGLLMARITAGALGRSAGHGFYRYDDRGAHADAALSSHSEGWTEADLAGALQAALVNEAARLLAGGTVQRASDIDVVMVHGYGFDRARGGPLFQADEAGLFAALRDSQRFADVLPVLWQPHPDIEDMVKNGTGFYGRPQ